MATTFLLPAEMMIYGASALRADLLRWLEAAPLEPGLTLVDGAAVSDIDASGVQLLVALQHSLRQRGGELRLERPSTPLVTACRALGVDLAAGGRNA